MSDRFTAEQRAAIEAQGKTIVSASAGSGKTTVMIEKIIRLIQSGGSVGEILAVTFTKKAAAQMKEKLCKQLIESINAADCDAENRARLKKQLAETPSADISTIHSFCSKLIRRHFFAAGVDNAFRVIGGDDAEGTALKNAALDELFEEAYEEKDDRFAHLLSVYWRKKSDNALRKIFLTAYENLRIRADYRQYLQSSMHYTEQTFAEICADLHALLKEKCAYYHELVEEELCYFQGIEAAPQIALATELCEGLQELLSAPDYFAACAVQKPKYTSKRTSKSDSDEKRLHIEKLAFLKEKIAKIYDGELAKTLSRQEEMNNFLRSGETAAALATYLLRFDEKYTEKKAERGVLDYNDLEHKALALLKDEDIACEVRAIYRYVFVDEYQDVNPVQEEIISRLSGENLFLVGDVKQSGDGKNLAMTRNFRSADAVLDAVNAQFSLAMTLQTCSVDYAADSYMERGGRYALNSGKVQIHFLGEEEKEPPKRRGVYSVREKARKKEQTQSLAAKIIRHIIENEKLSKVFDADIGEYRNVNYSDIAILSRKKQGQIAQTVAALSAEGIPVTSAAAVNVCEYSEVKTLIDILSLIDNAEQDVPLCSALLSAMGGLTADDLTQIRLTYREKDAPYFRAACRRYAAEQEDLLSYKLKKFYVYFEKLRSLSNVLSAGELLTKILSETHMEASLLSRENGVACTKRIHRFIEETGTPSPLCVHEFLERLRDLDYKIEFNENGGEDSVKVLTMHSSKGLEYPIVILDDLSASFRGVDHDEVLTEEKYGLAPRAYDTVKMTKNSTLLRRLYEEKELQSSVADELNLYYVALTRAKHTLHMLFEAPTVMPNAKYARSFAEFTDFSVWEKYFVQDEIFDVPKQDRTALAFHPDEELVRKIMDAFVWQYPHSGYENLPVKSSATDLLQGATPAILSQDERGFPSDTQRELETEGKRLEDLGANATGIVEGIAYHAFLEQFDFSALYDENGQPTKEPILREAIVRARERLARSQAENEALLDTEQLVKILSNRVFYELADMRLYKEQQFLVSLPIKDTYAYKSDEYAALRAQENGEEMIFQGAIDLLAIGSEGVRIIDYKFSSAGAEYLRSHYLPQMRLYRMATAKILKLPEERIRCTLVNIYRGFQVDVD